MSIKFNEMVSVGDKVIYYPCKCPLCRIVARWKPVLTMSPAWRTSDGFVMVKINKAPYIVNVRQVEVLNKPKR